MLPDGWTSTLERGLISLKLLYYEKCRSFRKLEAENLKLKKELYDLKATGSKLKRQNLRLKQEKHKCELTNAGVIRELQHVRSKLETVLEQINSAEENESFDEKSFKSFDSADFEMAKIAWTALSETKELRSLFHETAAEI